jgi:DNA helicase HerA-like ATPase
LAQLGNRVQHALRAFTPRDQKAVKAAAETFRPNPKLDTAKVIMELGKGEALVSFLEGNGTPSMVERCMVRPPAGRVSPITADERKALIAASPVKGKYDQTIDSESAYEVLQKRVHSGTVVRPADAPASPGAPAEASVGGGFASVMAVIMDVLHTIFGTGQGRRTRLSTGQRIARDVTRSVTNQVAGKVAADIGKSFGGKVGSSVGRAIVRGTMGGILRR